MTFDTAGNVGIGTTTPGYKLDVAGTMSVADTLYVGTNSTTTTVGTVAGAIYFAGTYGDNAYSHTAIVSRLYAASESSELVIFKGNDPAGGAGPDRIRLRGGAIAFDTYDYYTTDFAAENIRMYITSAGNVGIGTTTPGYKLDVNGSAKINGDLVVDDAGRGIKSSTGSYGNISVCGPGKGSWTGYDINGRFCFMGNGNEVGIHDNNLSWCVYFNNRYATFYQQVTAPSYNASSDYRLKSNIQPISKTIDHLKPIEYDLSGGGHCMGFLAHEIQEEFPFLVSGEKDGETMQSINYIGFIGLLVKEIQDLKSSVKTLQNKIEILESKSK
jgi:hypothetical protein